MFGEQYEAVIKGLDKIEQNPVWLVNSLRIIHFLSKAGKVKKDDQPGAIIKKIFEGCELFFTVQLHDYTNTHYVGKRSQISNAYALYLKLIYHVDYAHFSPSVLETYVSLYRNGKIASSFETGFLLRRITDKYAITGYEDVIRDNIDRGIENSRPHTLSLKEMIDLTKLTNDNRYFAGYTTRDLSELVEDRYNPLGYGAGLSRFLIHSVDKEIELL